MNHNQLIAFGCALLLATACSLPPFHSDEFQAPFSEQALAQKASFLSQKTPSADTFLPPNIIILMADDPYEEADLAEHYPEKTRELKTALGNWYAGMPKPLWPALVSFKHEDENGVFYFDN